MPSSNSRFCHALFPLDSLYFARNQSPSSIRFRVLLHTAFNQSPHSFLPHPFIPQVSFLPQPFIPSSLTICLFTTQFFPSPPIGHKFLASSTRRQLIFGVSASFLSLPPRSTLFKLGMTDQCSNEMSAWKSAGHKGVHHASHALCGWHKVNILHHRLILYSISLTIPTCLQERLLNIEITPELSLLLDPFRIA